MEPIQQKLEFAAVCVLVILSIILLPLLGSALVQASQRTVSITSGGTAVGLSASPNAVERSFDTVAGYASGVGSTAQNALLTSAKVVSNTTKSVASSIVSAGRMAGSGIIAATTFVGRTAIHAVIFTVNIPGNFYKNISQANVVSAMIRPTNTDVVPTIDANKKYKSVIAVTAKPASAANKSSSSKPTWPIHGAITTVFGTTGPLYHPIHTGIDISDGRPSGITAIHPYRPGKVLDVVHSSAGLGNHVTLDHGDGFTSVYGHLASTNVKVGQKVSTSDVLGREGSTGVSTGPHLHFEILKYGVYVNPLDYIHGRP